MQLCHVQKEKGEGFVKIMNSKGKVLAEHKDLQHNRNYSNRRKMASKIAEQVGAPPVETDGGEVDLVEPLGPKPSKKCPSACCVLQ